ncbi:MAG: hypothetical protein ACR2FM_04325 [Candidatus Saccharimonadales bacterium]
MSEVFSSEYRSERRVKKAERREQKATAQRYEEMELEFQRIDRCKEIIEVVSIKADEIKKADFSKSPTATYSYTTYNTCSDGFLENIAELMWTKISDKDSKITSLLDDDPRNITGVYSSEPFWEVNQLINTGRKAICYLAVPATESEEFDARLMIMRESELGSATLLVSPKELDTDFHEVATQMVGYQQTAEKRQAFVNEPSDQ